MTLTKRMYDVLLVSAVKKVNTALMPLFSGDTFDKVTTVDSIAKAQRKLVDRDYDLVIINAPLPDDFGRKFAIDVCTDSDRVALIIVANTMYDEISSKLTPHGVMVAGRPMELTVVKQLMEV